MLLAVVNVHFVGEEKNVRMVPFGGATFFFSSDLLAVVKNDVILDLLGSLPSGSCFFARVDDNGDMAARFMPIIVDETSWYAPPDTCFSV